MIQDNAQQTAADQTAAIAATVDQIRRSLTGELVGKPQAIDHLLDLRSAARGLPDLVARIDAVLADVPGQRTVATAWLGVVLTDVERLVSVSDTDQGSTVFASIEAFGAGVDSR